MPRNLIIHNFYSKSSPSGENNVVSFEKTLAHRSFFVFSDVIFKGRGRLDSLIIYWKYKHRVRKRLTKILKSEKFNTIVIHNTFPIIGDTFIRKIDPDVRVTMRLHNYRNLVVCGIFNDKAGNFCDLCVRKKVRLSPMVIFWRCYNGSFFKSYLVYVKILKIYLFQSLNRVDEVEFFSEFQKKTVMPFFNKKVSYIKRLNKIDKAGISKKWKNNKSNNKFVFIGRLSDEKGLNILLDAWHDWDTNIRLDIYGSGPLEKKVIEISKYSNVSFKGYLAEREKYNVMCNGALLMFPSQCIEGHPLVVEESKLIGMPGLISNIGPMSEYISETSLKLMDFKAPNLRKMIFDFYQEASK
jgi:glycosyltransferase involved in cell wall biosynthesis